MLRVIAKDATTSDFHDVVIKSNGELKKVEED